VAEDWDPGASEKSWPVPVNDAVCGLLVALSVTVKVPLRVPLVVGSKKTPIEQLAPAASVLPQVLSGAKSAGVAVTLLMTSAVLAGLVKVTDWGKPEVPTYWLGKLTLVGDK
jgi:hypothetical protein